MRKFFVASKNGGSAVRRYSFRKLFKVARSSAVPCGYPKLAVYIWALSVFFLLSPHTLAGTPSLTFTNGWVGEYTTSIVGPTNMYAFDGGTPDLNIRSVTISQSNAGTNLFVAQGNDIPVTVTVLFVNGRSESIQGSVNWRETGPGNVLRGVGLRLDQTIVDGYPLTLGSDKTYLLKVAGTNLSIANGGNVNGNAASVLDSLNGLLGSTYSFNISKSGPASVTQGGSVAFTIGLGNSGGGTSGVSATVQDVLPSGMTFVSPAVPGSGVSSVSCVQSSQTLTCTVGLAAGLSAYASDTTAKFVINATAPLTGASITNYASVDPNGGSSPPPAEVACSTEACASATVTLLAAGSDTTAPV